MVQLTRRSFLKGILALSASAAIPVELVEASKLIYSDDAVLDKPPAYILIDGKVLPFHQLSITKPKLIASNMYAPIGKNRFAALNKLYEQAEMTSIDLIVSGGQYEELFYRLSDFDFEVVYDKLPYTIKGYGWKSYIQTESAIISDSEPYFTTLGFNAEIDQWI